MIKSFKDADLERFWETGNSRHVPANIRAVVARKLFMLHAADNLKDLRLPPANRLEALKGDRMGQYSIRVNDQFRLCFTWQEGNVHDVEIVDYH